MNYITEKTTEEIICQCCKSVLDREGNLIKQTVINWTDDQKLNAIRYFIMDKYGLTFAEFTGKSRFRNIVKARYLFFAVGHILTRSANLEKIGSYVGKDHSTVIHGLKSVSNSCEIDQTFLTEVRTTIRDIQTEYRYVEFWKKRKLNIKPLWNKETQSI